MISFATQRAATGTPALTILRIAVAAAYPGCVCQARRRNCRTERRAESVAIQERMPPSPTERWRFCAVGFKAWGDSRVTCDTCEGAFGSCGEYGVQYFHLSSKRTRR